MIPCSLAKIKTKDGIALEGICVGARKRPGTALIWIHGLGSNFARGQTLTRALSGACAKNGIGYFKFNTRGHDIVSRAGERRQYYGAGFEKFEECILDIRAMIRFARKLGYGKIILAGHSTGANKALYYAYKTRGRNITAVALLGAVADRAARQKEIGARRLEKGIVRAKKLCRKDKDALMPISYGIISAERFLSLSEAGTAEDVFPYHDPHAKWKELSGLRVPVAVIFGSTDEHLDAPAKEILETFRQNAGSTKPFFGSIIKNAGHGFYRKEKEVSGELIRWITLLRKTGETQNGL